MNDYLHVALTTVVSFLSLWTITRVLGKKQISQLTLFDYITGITIGSLAAELISPEGAWLPILLALSLWGTLAWGFHWVDLKGRRIHRFLDGAPVILIRNGKILEQNLREEQINLEQLESMLRVKGYFDLSQVEFAVLETDGQLSVLPRSQYRPVQPRDLKVPTEYEGMPTQVMQEGRPLPQQLQKIGLSEEWLRRELMRQGITSFDEVMGAWLGTDGTLTVDRYQDGPH